MLGTVNSALVTYVQNGSKTITVWSFLVHQNPIHMQKAMKNYLLMEVNALVVFLSLDVVKNLPE